MTILNFLSSTLFIGSIICTVFIICVLIRNDKVYDFRISIINSYNAGNWRELERLLYKYSYDNMLYSFKPLKLEVWFTEEEIKIIKGGTDND